MILELTDSYKNLNPFKINFPSLTVLTGLNGTGKTNLLLEIKSGLIQSGVSSTKIRYVHYSELVPQGSTEITTDQIDNESTALWNEVKNLMNRKDSLEDVLKYFNRKHNFSSENALRYIIKESGKDFFSLDQEDFYFYYPMRPSTAVNDNIFYQGFAFLFKNYFNKFDENRYRGYRAKELGESVSFLSNEEFNRRYGEPPWDLANKVIQESGFGYSIEIPEKRYRNTPFKIKLIKKIDNAEIKFSDLSSGEKVIFSMVLALYNAKYTDDFPTLLLLDEPDAPLHPSMSKLLLRVIQKTFVDEKGMNVIISTHSPSTVALAPDKSIYIMNVDTRIPEKSAKDKALRLLMDGVPSISFDYENRRQIFVENKEDGIFYDNIYIKLRDASELHEEISLSFISSAVGNNTGSCDNVKSLVGQLRSNGNKQVLGIIDWDTEKNPNDGICVSGHEKRYSLENYALDPLFLSIFLLREKLEINKKDAYLFFGLQSDSEYISIPGFTQDRLQSLVDALCSYVIPLLPAPDQKVQDALPKFPATADVLLRNGMKLAIPNRYLMFRGHDLEATIIANINPLKRFSKTLKQEVLKKVIVDYPQFLPQELVELFRDLQTK